MHVVVVGSGGREAAIAHACRHHGHDVRVTTAYDPQQDGPVDLVIVGPETALATGTADRCRAAGVPCFGPTAALARLESSKAHTRSLAAELGLASPRFVSTASAEEALAWWRELGAPVVVKADGLAAGKGVVVPSTDDETEEAVRAAAAAGTFVVEERLAGPEVSLLAFCDGTTALPLPLAQDHKRIGEGDTGPNTGGMGAYAPAPCRYSADELTAMFVQPVLDHLSGHGERYVGILYAGLMLTADGPRLLEFNCRFGDPECETLMPLLGPELARVLLACARGELAAAPPLSVQPGCSACVIAAAEGYPGEVRRGDPIAAALENGDTLQLFHAGSRLDGEGRCLTAGGRVLAVVAQAGDFDTAFERAYAGLAQVHFSGITFRRDIGHQVRARRPGQPG